MRVRILILSVVLLGILVPEGLAVPVPVEQRLLVPSDRGIASGETIQILSRWDAPGYDVTADFSELDDLTGGQVGVDDSANDGSYLIVYSPGSMEGLPEESGIVIPITALDPADSSIFTVRDLEVCRRHLSPVPEHVSTTISGDSSRFGPGEVIIVLSRWRETTAPPLATVVAHYRAITSELPEN